MSFAYGPDRQRVKRIDQLSSGLTTTYYVGGKAMEAIFLPNNGGVERRYYIGDFAVVSKFTSAGITTTGVCYFHRDHLGSLDAMTDEAGNVVSRPSFDAWGKRRQTNWVPQAHVSAVQSLTPCTTRGFTGHEMLDPVGLVHMNGRVGACPRT